MLLFAIAVVGIVGLTLAVGALLGALNKKYPEPQLPEDWKPVPSQRLTVLRNDETKR